MRFINIILSYHFKNSFTEKWKHSCIYNISMKGLLEIRKTNCHTHIRTHAHKTFFLEFPCARINFFSIKYSKIVSSPNLLPYFILKTTLDIILVTLKKYFAYFCFYFMRMSASPACVKVHLSYTVPVEARRENWSPLELELQSLATV